MPNWSYNRLIITGSPDDMKKFYEVAIKPNSNGEKSFRLGNVFPMPEKIVNTISPSSSAKDRQWMNESVAIVRDNTISDVLGEESSKIVLIPVENNTDEKCAQLKKEFGADNWYDWNIQKYGTKWDCEALEADSIVIDSHFECTFDTAWSPPDKFVDNLQQMFPNIDIRLTFELEGSDTCGVYYTERNDDEVFISYEEDELKYISYDGRDIYQDDEGEWRYQDDDEICDDFQSVNPFNED